jgi:hypothetical protein
MHLPLTTTELLLSNGPVNDGWLFPVYHVKNECRCNNGNNAEEDAFTRAMDSFSTPANVSQKATANALKNISQDFLWQWI